MFGRRHKGSSGIGAVDGGEGRGIPLGGHDERPPTGYRSVDDDGEAVLDREHEGEEFLWDDGDPSDRRRDPLRKP